MDRLLGVSQSEMLLWTAAYFDADVYSYNPFRLKLQDGIGFANAKTVKHIAQNGGNTVDAVTVSHDYDRGRYNGCYFSSKAALAVYNNFSPGFTWSKQAASPEKTAIDLFVNTI